MMSDDVLSLSEEDELADNIIITSGDPSYSGTLSKWTNYIHGWQTRFIVLKDGTLTYFKSETESSFGCRGAISIQKAQIKFHEFDECRFDVSVGDCVWYLRAESPDERNKWVDVLDAHRNHIDSAYGSDNSLRRHGSALSLGSVSATSFKKGRGLREKLAEIETFRDILCKQVDTLQSYFDDCHNATSSLSVPNNHEENLDQIDSSSSGVRDKNNQLNSNNIVPSHHVRLAVDFKGEAITFKATTAGILANLSHCIELMQQREENWKKRLEKEIESRKKLEELFKQSNLEQSSKVVMIDGPDYEEGPHSKIKEEEFFDALDAMLDRHDQHEEEKRQLKLRAKTLTEPSSSLPETCDHPLWPEIDKVTQEQLYYARLEVSEGDDPNASAWHLFAEEGEMRLFKRDLEIDGLVCDPLKAVHTVKGITAHEMCYHFFSPDVRWDWENTLESMKVVEEINPNSLLFHQIHKRVWPAAQRDTVFWSHIRRIESVENTEGLKDIWIVCNNSIERPDIQTGRCIRMKLTVSLVCETWIDQKNITKDKQITRDDLTCKIIYCSTINPGGWAPASVLRALYKREYPKFVKRFSQYVIDAQEKKPILF